MSATTLEKQLIRPDLAEKDRIKAVIDQFADIEAKTERYFLQDDSGHVKLELPPSLFLVLHQAAIQLVQGNSISIVNYDHDLTTQQAADLLNVSRPYLIRLLGEEKLQYRLVGTHRRIKMGDLMAYKETRDALRREHLNELVRVSESLGLYDEVSEPLET